MRSMIRTSAILASLLGLSATAGQAQSGTIQATATVLTAITVTGAVPLAFGNVTPGVAKTIAAAAGGRFDLGGQGNTGVAISFTLPTVLQGPGANTMPIATWTGLHNGTNAPGSATAFVPSAAATNSAFVAGALFVWVGATVNPSGAQAAGSYTAPVVLTAAYL